ncbi:MAG: methyltransferase [Prolixibacteraceae bacterium]|jgi:tRNA1Val (adenine37-N6)-methyltransferase|nr:methyltransferase [Prolixibacteraceae bacterium]
MSNSWFQFKQFLITQENSALKVGTDGVLLGAWCGVTGAKRILDVGTGTGVIALMLAQRSEAHIAAVEIDKNACRDALHNFQNSPWGERLALYSSDFNDFQKSHAISFDLVVCNPPFFKKSMKSSDPASSIARHDVSLSFEQLITGAKKLLTSQGRLAVILPIEVLDDFRETARLAGFYLSRKTTVIPKVGKPPKRVLLEFSVLATYPESDELVILIDQQRFSENFIELTREFYLNMP